MDEGEKVHLVPLYGLREHHVQLHSCSEDSEFYVVVQGSRLTHVTAAKLGDDGHTLSFVVPGHDLPEGVLVTPYRLSEDHVEPCGIEFSFQYIKDVAQDIAEYLKSSSNQLGPHSYLHIQKIFCKSTQRNEEFPDIKEDLRLLDEKITCAMSNLVYPLEWTNSDFQTRQHNETDSDPQNSKPILHLAVHLGLVHLSHFLTYQHKNQRPLILPSQDVDTPPIVQKGEEHSADPAAGVWCLWSDSSSMLRFCLALNSLFLTVQHSLGQSSHQTIIQTLRERLKDPSTFKLVTAFKSYSEVHQKQYLNDKDLKKKLCMEETQTNNGFEEHLVLSLDDDSCEVCPSSLSVNTSLRFDGKYSLMNIQNDLEGTSEGDTAVHKVHISGVTSNSTRTDSQLWDVEDTAQALMNMDNMDLSPSLVALELNSEDDSTDAMSLLSPFLPDVEENDVKLKDFSPFSTLSCTRSLSASSCEHTSKEPKQDVRLRSYSYSSSKIGFCQDQSTRDISPDRTDSVSYGRSLLQALSLSKSLSLLHPYKQKTSISEQSHEKREVSFCKRAQSAEDECSLELVQSLQHLTLSEFLKEIEEEEQDKYNAPVKVESEKHKVIRTFSFLKNRMSTTRIKSKGKKDREAKDRQLNGHQFSSGPCLGPTMCMVCDKPATGKAILHCSVCTTIVHKNCKDSIPPCLKNKYAVPMVKNKTASLPQNFIIRESPPQFIPVPTCIPPDEKKDIGTLPCPLFKSAERLESENSESESDHSKVTSSTEDPIITPVSTTDFSSGEDCVDAYIFKDILVDAAHYEAESWSSSVDHRFCRKQDKKCVKRQDIIYELMQTEIHHLQTLHVMAEVFRRGVKEEVQLDAEAVERLFPCLDQLLLFHHGFFSALKERRQNSQSQGQNNYLIQRIGDVLLQQFSDENGKKMTHLYGEFCSHHMEAVSFFKELQLNNKKFLNFIKQQGNNYLARRREIPECILLVTQRITKYPVLLERILQYTQAGTEEHRDLTKALALIRDVIIAVDQRVCKYERQRKLQEVWTRMENRSSAKLKNGHTFRKQDMMRPGQTLLHEGVLLWKSATGRLKDVLALLLTDTLIFLQEKDQKFVFAAVDQKPPVIALQKLIVREVANEERGMFLISASIAGPEMYEVHTSSKDERNIWMRLIREAVESCPEEEQDYTSESEEERRAADARLQKIHRLQESLMSHDQQICTSLEEKLQIYAELSAVTGKSDSSIAEPRLLVRKQQEDVPHAALLLSAALQEAETLKTILSAKTSSRLPGGNLEYDVDSMFSVSPSSHLESYSSVTYPEENEEGWSKEDSDFHSMMEMQKKDIYLKVSQSVLSLTQLLYSLKAAVTLQDSWYEVQKLLASEIERPSPRPQSRPHFTSLRGNTLQEQEKQRNLEKRKEEVATAQRLQDHLRQEKERWERECQTRENQQEELERRLQEREKQCHLEAERLKREREELDTQLEEYQQSLERLREGQKSVEKERERLEAQNKRVHVWRHSQQRNTGIQHMVIPLDTHQTPAMTQSADPNDNGSVFVNEANTSINNRHVHHRENDPSTHNCLNALLARSNSRRSSSGLSTTSPESDSAAWVMGPGYFYSPTGSQGNGHTPTDHREGSIREAWSSTADSCFMLPHHSDPLDLFSADADSSGEEPKEETIVYL